MDVSSDHERRNPKRLMTLACSAGFPGGNNLLHQLVVDSSDPNGSIDESCRIAVLRSMCDAPGGAVDAINDDGYTALHLSVLKGNLLMVKGLLSCLRNIDVDETCCADSRGQRTANWGKTALHLAAQLGNLGIVEELCNNGAAIDVQNRWGYTALFIAAECGHLDTMKFLVSKGADVNAECRERTPLGAAASLRCNLEAVKYLVGCGAEVNPIIEWTPLRFAVKSGDVAIFEFLKSNGAVVDDTLLHFSALSGRIEIVEYLLRSGADVNEEDERALTPFHWVVRWGRSAEMATLLLDRGADLNARDLSRRTPLHLVAIEGRSEMATLLLDRGSDANAVDFSNLTPLHYAVDRRNSFIREFLENLRSRVKPDAARLKKFKMAELLLEQGEDLRAIDEEGRTPLHDAVCGKNDEWIRVYDERYRESAKVIRTLLEKGADVNARNGKGHTPLEFAKIDLKMYEGS